MQISSVFQAVKSQVCIADFIGNYLGIDIPNKDQIQIKSPFKDEQNPSFAIYKKTQTFKCFTSGKFGDVFHFVEEMENCDRMESLKIVAERSGIELDLGDNKVSKGIRELISLAQSYFHEGLLDTEAGKIVLEQYCTPRGLTLAGIKEFGIGFAQGTRYDFCKYAKSKGYSEAQLVESGLGKKGKKGTLIDVFRGRLMFPFYRFGSCVGFAGRTIDKGVKYVNTAESPIFKKGELLFGLEQVKSRIKKLDYCILAEGYTDSMTPYIYGDFPVVSTGGTGLSEKQVEQIKRFTENIIICRDGDSPGQKATARDIKLFLKAGLNPKVIALGETEDPDSFVRQEGGVKAFEEKIINAVPWIDWMVHFRKGLSNSLHKEIKKMITLLPEEDAYLQQSLTKKVKDVFSIEASSSPEHIDVLAPLYEHDGRYWSGYGRNQVERSNFTITSLYKLLDTEGCSLYQVTKFDGRSAEVLISDEVMNSNKAFNSFIKNIPQLGIASCLTPKQLNHLNYGLASDFGEECDVYSELGWDAEKEVYVYNNGFLSESAFFPCDDNGIIDMEGEYYFLKRFVGVSKKRDRLAEALVYKEGNTTFKEYLTLLQKVYPENWLVGFSYSIAAVFFSEITAITSGVFPIFWVEAPNGYGKSDFVKILGHLFGNLSFLNYGTNGTIPSFNKYCEGYRDCLTILNEAEADTDVKLKGTLKAIADGEGRAKMGGDRYEELLFSEVTSAVVCLNQVSVAAIETLSTRCILALLSRCPEERTLKDIANYDRLFSLPIGHLLKLLLPFKGKGFRGDFVKTFDKILNAFTHVKAKQRLINNYSIILTPLIILIEKGIIPLSSKTVMDGFLAAINRHNKEVSDKGLSELLRDFINMYTSPNAKNRLDDNCVYIKGDEVRVSMSKTFPYFREFLPKGIQNTSKKDLMRKLKNIESFKEYSSSTQVGFKKMYHTDGRIKFEMKNSRYVPYKTSCLIFDREKLGVENPHSYFTDS